MPLERGGQFPHAHRPHRTPGCLGLESQNHGFSQCAPIFPVLLTAPQDPECAQPMSGSALLVITLLGSWNTVNNLLPHREPHALLTPLQDLVLPGDGMFSAPAWELPEARAATVSA